MTLKESFTSLIADLREAKAAAESHNVTPHEPPTGNLALSNPADGASESTSDKPTSSLPTTNTTVTAAQPSSDVVVVGPEPISSATQQAYIPPPPPPKNLPHGWTARYDEGKGKFSYSHGLDNTNEQWHFRKRPPFF